MPRQAPIIAILTDFGESDWYVASMKGVIARLSPRTQIIDITHQIDPGNVHAGAFVLSQCYDDFPDATVFLCVVDPGVGTDRKPIIVYTGDHYFVAPNNGLLGLVKTGLYRAFEIDENLLGARLKTSNTFHGRDLFAPTAAVLAAGASPAELGKPLSSMASLDFDFEPVIHLPKKGYILYFDRFGNGISNLKMSARGPLPREAKLVSGRSVPFRKTFSDVPVGQPVAYVGSGGLVEIAINRGNARKELGLETDPDFLLNQ